MRKTKEVLRLRFEVGLGLRQIARSCSIGLGTVHEYLQRAEAAGVTWPLGEDWDEDRLEAALFGGPPRARSAALPMPDFAELHQQRQVHPHLTQQLLWEEYRQANPDGYRYYRFCELFKRWCRKQDVVLRQEHKAGEKLFVDWAGTTIPIHRARDHWLRSNGSAGRGLSAGLSRAANWDTREPSRLRKGRWLMRSRSSCTRLWGTL